MQHNEYKLILDKYHNGALTISYSWPSNLVEERALIDEYDDRPFYDAGYLYGIHKKEADINNVDFNLSLKGILGNAVKNSKENYEKYRKERTKLEQSAKDCYINKGIDFDTSSR